MKYIAPLLVLAGCSFPAQDERPMVDLDYTTFVNDIQPIFAARCANPACHGRPERALSTYAPKRFRADPQRVHLDEPLTEQEMRHNFVAACIFASEADGPEETPLLQKPLADPVYHGGGAVFFSDRDSDYITIHSWIAGGDHSGGGAP